MKDKYKERAREKRKIDGRKDKERVIELEFIERGKDRQIKREKENKIDRWIDRERKIDIQIDRKRERKKRQMERKKGVKEKKL